jgi:hypothetical protein
MQATFTYAADGDDGCSLSGLEEEEDDDEEAVTFSPPPRLTVLTQALMNPTIFSPYSATCGNIPIGTRARVIHQYPKIKICTSLSCMHYLNVHDQNGISISNGYIATVVVSFLFLN